MLVATRDALQNKTIWVANMHKKSEQYKYAKIPEIYQKNFWEIRTFPSTFPRKRRVYPTFSTTDIYVRIAKSPSMYLERLGIRWDGLQNWVIWAKSLSKCSSFRSQIPIRHISKRLEKGSTLINHPRLHISRCGILQTWESHYVKLILNKFTWIIIIQLFVPCTLASSSLV